jgi:branched-chain amino acid transport system permease protein
MGAILLVVVLAAPEGLLPFMARQMRRFERERGVDNARNRPCFDETLKQEEGKS